MVLLARSTPRSHTIVLGGPQGPGGGRAWLCRGLGGGEGTVGRGLRGAHGTYGTGVATPTRSFSFSSSAPVPVRPLGQIQRPALSTALVFSELE